MACLSGVINFLQPSNYLSTSSCSPRMKVAFSSFAKSQAAVLSESSLKSNWFNSKEHSANPSLRTLAASSLNGLQMLNPLIDGDGKEA